MKAQAATMADIAADIARRRHIGKSPELNTPERSGTARKAPSSQGTQSAARIRIGPVSDTSRLGPAIGLGNSQEAPGRVRATLEAAEAQMRLAMAGRRFSIGEPGDRRGAKPSRPDIAAGLGRSSMA